MIKEIRATPIIIEGKGDSPLFMKILVKDIITNIIYEFKCLNFISN